MVSIPFSFLVKVDLKIKSAPSVLLEPGNGVDDFVVKVSEIRGDRYVWGIISHSIFNFWRQWD